MKWRKGNEKSFSSPIGGSEALTAKIKKYNKCAKYFPECTKATQFTSF